MSLSKKIKSQLQPLVNNLSEKNKGTTLSKINKILTNDKPKDNTLTVRYSLTKKLFKGKTTDTAFLSKIRPNPKITESVIENNERVRDNKKLIDITEDDVRKILSFHDSSKIFELMIWLLFVSGRRTSELLTAKFTNAKSNKAIRIKGVKKRSDSDTVECEFIPLVSKTKFFKVYNKFKRILNYSNLGTIHRTLDRRIKRHFNSVWHPHLLRGAHANYAYKFRNKDKDKINTFIQNQLCHQSVRASLSYTGYNIAFDNDIVR